MIDSIKEFFNTTFTNPYIAGIIISMLPIFELRGGIPYIYFRLGAGGFANLSKAFMCAFIGSSLVIPILLLLLLPTLKWLKRRKTFTKMAHSVENHFDKKSKKLEQKSIIDGEKAQLSEREKRTEKYKYFGLFLFTAVPLPLTGVWSASAVAAFLKLDFKKSLFFILLGNFTAGILVSSICLIFNIFI
jgi:uncharacterized membrane protein